MTSLLFTALFYSSAWLLVLQCNPVHAQSIEVKIYGDELAQGWGDYRLVLVNSSVHPLFGRISWPYVFVCVWCGG